MIESEITERIQAINWFINCGKPIEKEVKLDIKYIDSWEKAKAYYQSIDWEEVTLEAQNVLTAFLHDKHLSQYLSWNNITKEAKSFLEKEITPKLCLLKNNYYLDDAFVSSVRWDILGSVMEFSYRQCKSRPEFFLKLLCIYEAGNFPCGWEGDWPHGRLVVFNLWSLPVRLFRSPGTNSGWAEFMLAF